MAENTHETGTIGWMDLTINNAEEIRDFYSSVAGWKPEPLSMGDYNDFVMNTPDTGKSVAGICHARGDNAGLPPQWLMYINVNNINNSTKKCEELGGQVLVNIKEMGNYGKYCVIKDPAGAVCALFEPKHQN